MIFHSIPLNGAYLIDIEKNQDERGFFSRLYCEQDFSNFGLVSKWAQINSSYSEKRGTLRGLHFQRSPYAEVKVIRCIKGVIWDVIVDLRRNSTTYGEWYGAEMSEENRVMMYVPKGFAHGFITLSDHSEVIYFVSSFYNQSSEGGLIWCDKDIDIQWPIAPVIISSKDLKNQSLKNLEPIFLENE